MVWCKTGKSARIRCTSQVSETAGSRVDNVLVLILSLQRRVQLFQHSFVEFSSDRLDLDLRDHFFSESVGQEVAAKLRVDSACLEVKQFFRIDLAHGGAVRALH